MSRRISVVHKATFDTLYMTRCAIVAMTHIKLIWCIFVMNIQCRARETLQNSKWVAFEIHFCAFFIHIHFMSEIVRQRSRKSKEATHRDLCLRHIADDIFILKYQPFLLRVLDLLKNRFCHLRFSLQSVKWNIVISNYWHLKTYMYSCCFFLVQHYLLVSSLLYSSSRCLMIEWSQQNSLLLSITTRID